MPTLDPMTTCNACDAAPIVEGDPRGYCAACAAEADMSRRPAPAGTPRRPGDACPECPRYGVGRPLRVEVAPEDPTTLRCPNCGREWALELEPFHVRDRRQAAADELHETKSERERDLFVLEGE